MVGLFALASRGKLHHRLISGRSAADMTPSAFRFGVRILFISLSLVRQAHGADFRIGLSLLHQGVRMTVVLMITKIEPDCKKETEAAGYDVLHV